MDDLVAWLTQVWDEQEKAARAAFSNQEDPEHGWGEQGRAVTPHVGVIHEDVQRAHVVAWHPGVVLARIAADRQILALHRPSGGDCRTCCGEPYIEEYWDGETETTEWKRADLPWPCPTVRLLAQQYADRPGYQEAWKP